MTEADRELLVLRQKILALNDALSPVNQLSWRIKTVKDVYNFDSMDIEVLEAFYVELNEIYKSFLDICKKELRKGEDYEF